MPTNPLVLSEALDGSDENVPLGRRIHDLLTPFLDAAAFTAVGFVHGRSNSARKAYDRASRRLFDRRGLIWFDVDDPLADLDGEHAELLATAFEPIPDYTMAFFAPLTKRSNWALTRRSLLPGHIDAAYLDAGMDR